MKRQIVVIGLGRFGVSLATTLTAAGHDVLAVDKDERKIQAISSQVTHVVEADATNEAVLKELGVANFDIAIVTIGSAIESSVLATILLKKLGVNYVVARASGDLHGSILEKIGADSVVYAEREIGVRVAHGITLTEVSDYMAVASNYGIAKFKVPPHLAGDSLSALGFGHTGKWEAAALLIQREKEVIVTPDLGEVVRTGDVLILAGGDDKLEKMLGEFREKKNTG